MSPNETHIRRGEFLRKHVLIISDNFKRLTGTLTPLPNYLNVVRDGAVTEFFIETF